MANDLTNVVKHYSENTFFSVRKIGELNLKLWENLSDKHIGHLKIYVDLGNKHIESIAKAKDVGEIILQQQNTAHAFNKQLVSQWRETADLLVNARQEWVTVAEEAARYTQDSAEKTLQASKKLASEAADKLPEAVQKVTAEVVGLTRQIAEKSAPKAARAAV